MGAVVYQLAAERRARAQARITDCQTAWVLAWQQSLCLPFLCFWQLQEQHAVAMQRACATPFVTKNKQGRT